MLKPFLLLLRMLPNGVIFVLNAQRLQLLPTIQTHEFFNKDFHRNAVRNNMMHVEHQNMAFRSQLNKAYPQQRWLSQVKRTDETVNHRFDLLLSA